MAQLTWIDFTFFGGFLGLSLLVGTFHAVKSQQKQRQRCQTPTTECSNDSIGDYLMGGWRMPILPVVLSILTTFVSGITLLGSPGEIFQRGLLFWLSHQTAVPALLFTMVFILPLFYRLRLTSIFEYFEIRFGSVLMRRMTAFFFLLNTVFYMAIVLYSPAVALSGVTNLPTEPFILENICRRRLFAAIQIVGLVGTFYTTIGGIKAVVWTDTLQAVFIYSGLGVLILKGMDAAGGWHHIWQVADEGGRLGQLTRFNADPAQVLQMSADRNSSNLHLLQYNSVWITLLGGFSLSLSLMGVNQMAMQRYCSLPSLQHARLVIGLTIPASLVLTSMVCLLGPIMLAYYWQCNPLETGQIRSQDQLTVLFATEILGVLPGLTGLFLACLFSGTLSTLSSGLNSMSAVIWTDFIQGSFGRTISDSNSVIINKLLVCCFGLVATGFAFAAGPLGGIVYTAFAILGVLGGPVTGLFLTGIFVSKADNRSALFGFASSLSLMLWMVFGHYRTRPYHGYSLPTNSTCPNATVSLPLSYDGQFGDPSVFYLYRISPFLYTFLGSAFVLFFATLSSVILGKTASTQKVADREENSKNVALHTIQKIEA